MTTIITDVVLVDDQKSGEFSAVAGFLAGYCGSTRRSYATDLRLFAAWCAEAKLQLFGVRRAHLELFGRWMEKNGKMRSTVARRDFTSPAPNVKWCADMTEIPTLEGKLYLTDVEDLFSRPSLASP